MGALDARPDGHPRSARLVGRLADSADGAHVRPLDAAGKLIANNLMASLAEFEPDLLRERVKSGIAAAKARGQTFGRRAGYRPSDRHAPEVVRLSSEVEKLSQRAIGQRLGITKTTVNEILKRQSEPGATVRAGQ